MSISTLPCPKDLATTRAFFACVSRISESRRTAASGSSSISRTASCAAEAGSSSAAAAYASTSAPGFTPSTACRQRSTGTSSQIDSFSKDEDDCIITGWPRPAGASRR